MEDKLILLNKLKEIRSENKISQSALAEMVGVARNTISSIETGLYAPTAKLAYALCIALDKKFEEVFYFDGFEAPASEKSKEADSESGGSSISDKALQKTKEFLIAKGWSAEEILDFIIFITK